MPRGGPRSEHRAPATDPYIELVERANDRSVAWYLNYLVGAIEGPVPGHAPFSERHAACVWAGVDVADYSIQGALNVKAGNTDRAEWLPIRAVLNQLAQGKTLREFNLNRGVLVSEREALLRICKRG